MSSGKIREELMAAAEIAPKRGESERDFLIRLQQIIGSGITEEVWNGLSDEAQDWNNDAADALDQGKPIPSFKDEDAAPEAEATGRRGRRSAEPEAEPEKTVAYEPKAGDRVTVTTGRGKKVETVVVEVDDKKGLLITNVGGKDGNEKDDEEFDLEKVTVAPAEEPPAATGRRGRSAPATEPDEPETPQQGDTVEAITARDKTIVGVIVELNDDDMLLKDVAGTEHELTVSKLKSVKVKVKGEANVKASAGKATEPAATGRRSRGGAAPAADAKDDDSKRAKPGMGNRVRELCCADPKATLEDVMKTLKKEGIEFRDVSVNMIYKDVHFVFDELRKHKLLK